MSVIGRARRILYNGIDGDTSDTSSAIQRYKVTLENNERSLSYYRSEEKLTLTEAEQSADCSIVKGKIIRECGAVFRFCDRLTLGVISKVDYEAFLKQMCFLGGDDRQNQSVLDRSFLYASFISDALQGIDYFSHIFATSKSGRKKTGKLKCTSVVLFVKILPPARSNNMTY
jgi:hypothetical protein